MLGRLLTHPALLHTLRHHDNVVNILLPRHFPEVIFGARKRSLSGNVFSSKIVALWGIYSTKVRNNGPLQSCKQSRLCKSGHVGGLAGPGPEKKELTQVPRLRSRKARHQTVVKGTLPLTRPDLL